jgi:hypothetical protein
MSLKRKDTPEAREFWDYAERTQREVEGEMRQRGSQNRIRQFIDRMDKDGPKLTNGEKVFMCSILLSDILHEAPAGLACALQKEVINALEGRPSRLRELCDVPKPPAESEPRVIEPGSAADFAGRVDAVVSQLRSRGYDVYVDPADRKPRVDDAER